jgi:glycosyltransferase involved in cell wall biosynthesis
LGVFAFFLSWRIGALLNINCPRGNRIFSAKRHTIAQNNPLSRLTNLKEKEYLNKTIKLLIVAEDMIFPENTNGIAKTLFNVLKDNQSLDVTFYCPEAIRNIPEGFSHVAFETYKDIGKRKLSLFSKVKSFIGKTPFIRANEELLEEAEKPIKNKLDEIDVILIAPLSMAPLLEVFSEAQRKKTILLSIDSYSYWFSFKVKNESNSLKKLIWWIEMKKGEAYERKYYDKCALALFVSRQDAAHAESLGPTRARKVGMRYGIDIDKSNAELLKFKGTEKEDDTLIFTGNLSYGPNLDAIHFLLDEVLPRVWAINSKVRIYFLGGGAPQFLKNHRDNRILVTGFVESLAPYMIKTTLFVSPLFFGAGTKTKVLEAMGYGKVVVGTKDSFTEIVCEDGKDCIMIDPPRDGELWARTITDLLKDKKRIQQIEVAAKETIKSHHDWKVNKKAYVEEFLKVINSSDQPQASPKQNL